MTDSIEKTSHLVRYAITLLSDSIKDYMQEALKEMMGTNPNPDVAYGLVVKAHRNILSLEDVIATALSKGVRLEEELLLAIQTMHDNIHKLGDDVSLLKSPAIQGLEELLRAKTVARPNIDKAKMN
jgi:hypothetical protein